MNSARKLAIAGLLVLATAGCAKKKVRVVAAAQAQAPAKDAGKAGALYPPPLMSAQPQDDTANTPPPTVAKTDNPPPTTTTETDTKKPAAARKPKPSKPSTNSSANPAGADGTGDGTAAASTGAPPPTPAQTQTANEIAAAAAEPSAVSPIGELSTGEAAGQSGTHKATLDLINNTENSANAIKRTLTAQEQETVTQIKAFVSKARAAFENNDFDGAATLAVKAKLLLDELNELNKN